MQIVGFNNHLNPVGADHVAIDEGPDNRSVNSSECLLNFGPDDRLVIFKGDISGTKVAQLHLAVGRSPEVESHLGPERSCVGEGEDNKRGRDLGGRYVEGMGPESRQREVLEG